MSNIEGANWYQDLTPVPPVIGGVLSVAQTISVTGHPLLGAEYLTDACAEGGEFLEMCQVDLTIAQCVPLPPPPPPPTRTGCVVTHPDYPHAMAWVADAPPQDWVGPFVIDWGDGTVEQSQDGEEAHEYELEGVYVITFSDSSGKSCRVAISLPHEAQQSHACFDPTPLTVAEAISQIGTDKTCAAAVLHIEQNGKARSTLIAHLQAMLEDDA